MGKGPDGDFRDWIPYVKSLGAGEVERRIANSQEASNFKATGKVDPRFARRGVA